ncbi:hypothetical protein JR316_0012765 [Psilocybe cubensis]|uniref:Uncharacterized protein n=2 Tax=Psilocybe cubensis TaxID=181762 RepID=A0ACB8GG82_PSICU|nr:hypothetical protein JR316_0012765 [Psilocybe cubensis]KAH9474307.1 hypothetical protein JR316_0012765 [Psilocybe cubensis]
MAMNATWIPLEDSLTLLSERTWLSGAVLTGVGYGVVLTMYFLCVRQLLKTMDSSNRIQRIALLTYTSLITLFGTLFVAACTRMTELSFVDYRLYPGGPAAFENDMFSIPVDELGNVAFVLANWFADALMVWRCINMYRSTNYPTILVVAIPGIAYLGSFTMGVMWLLQVSASQSSPWLTNGKVNFTPPYYWLSLALNMTMTVAIVIRLLFFRWRISKVMGRKFGSQYVGVAAMLVESALLYSSFALLFLVPFALNHPLANLFIQVLAEVQIVAPLMIIYRVASGEAFSTNKTAHMLSTNGVDGAVKGIKLSKLTERSATLDGGPHSSSKLAVKTKENMTFENSSEPYVV